MISTQFLNDCLAGNEEAIQLLIRTYQRQVFQLALSILDHSNAPLDAAIAQAEIATRETFVTVLDKLGSYREDTPFPIWLFRNAVLVSRKRYHIWQRERWWGDRLGWLWDGVKRLIRRGADRLPSEAAVDPQEEAQAQKRASDPLWQAVRRLDDRFRIPVVLRYYHDFSLEDIGRILHMSEGTVHARLDKAREELAASSSTKRS